MKADQIEIVGTLRSGIKNIIELYEKEKEEKEKILEEKEKLIGILQKKEKIINDFEHKYNTLKVAKSLLAGNDNGNDARLKVNRMVREIDKCIALLNR
jgi:hypothetical protein